MLADGCHPQPRDDGLFVTGGRVTGGSEHQERNQTMWSSSPALRRQGIALIAGPFVIAAAIVLVMAGVGVGALFGAAIND